MKKTIKILSVICTIMLIIGTVSVALPASAATGDTLGMYDFTIQNVYKDINWSNVRTYKGATHVHTVRSDADVEIDDMILEYYSLGFDALALTDHGTVNYGWTEDQYRHDIFEYQYFVHGPTDELSESNYKKVISGTRDSRGYGMMEIPLGIELNGASTKKCHINGYYADAGDGDMEIGTSWPRTAVEKNYNAGGFTHINHVGEWTDGRDTPATYNDDWLTRFASIYTDYCPNRGGRNVAAQTDWMTSHNGEAGCIGMELVNTTDNRTKNDRKYVYDAILKRLAPQGINVFGFCEDDAHEYSDCDKNAQMFLINGNKSLAISEANASPNSTQIQTVQQYYRDAMFYGEFYACSKSSKNSYELGDGFLSVGAYPSVSNISVDNTKDQISLTCADATKVRLVADGLIIDTVKTSASGQTVVFDLNKYEEKINSYVRIYMTGAGGITYLQPFLVSKQVSDQATVQFKLPISDAVLTVYNSGGSQVSDSYKYENNTYVLPAGTYTYTAQRRGYETTEGSFIVTAADISNHNKKVIEVEMTERADVSSTTFYVPETIYVDPSDGLTFSKYIDRGNSINGALNRTASSTGNIFFNREGATNITLTYELCEGVDIGSLSLQSASSSSNSLSSRINSGSLSRALADGEHSLIKWTVTYQYKGSTDHAYAFTYVYKTGTSNTSTLGAGSYGAARKNAAEFPHDSLWTSISVFVSGFHRMESTSAHGYKFAPYYGETISDIGKPYDHSPEVEGNGYYWNGDSSQGGSGHGSVTGGTAYYYADKSRVQNFNQFPYFIIGVDFNAADECREYDSDVKAFAQFDSQDLVRITFDSGAGTYTKTSSYNGSTSTETGTKTGDYFDQFSGTRIYYSDTSSNDKFNKAVPAESTRYTINFYARGKKTGKNSLLSTVTRTAICDGNIFLNLEVVDKAALRAALNASQSQSLQKEWFENENEWDNYQDAIIRGYTVLGNPAADEDEINSAYNAVIRADDNLHLKPGTATVKHYWVHNGLTDLIYAENSYTYHYGDGLVANAVTMEGYTYQSYQCFSNGTEIASGSAPTDVDTQLADRENYEWRFYYSPDAYNVTYKANNGQAFEPSSSNTAYFNQNYSVAANIPVKEGYTFNGWYFDLKGETVGAGSTFQWNYNENGEFNANWVPIKYDVSYNTSGGGFSEGYSIPDSAKKAEYGSTYNIISEIPSRTGYSFTGWKLNGGVTYTGGSDFVWNIATNGEFVAQWGTTPYVVSFDPVVSGVTVSPSSKTVYFGDEYGDLPASTRSGYSISWYSNSSYANDTLITKNSTVNIPSNHVLYAKWTPITYSINYMLDGGTVTGSNPTSYTIESPALTLLNPTRTGYVFNGWTGTDVEENTTTVTIPAGSIGDRNFTAHWSIGGYTITYQGMSGATNDSRNPSSYAFNSSNITIYPPSKPGYTFTGWTGSNGSGQELTVMIPSGSTGNKTYTAHWDKDIYTITYDLMNGTATGSNPASYSVDTATFTLSNPTRAGYNFTGWREENDKNPGGVTTTVETGSTGNLKFIANWTEIGNYVVTYDLDGGRVVGSNPNGYSRGDHYYLINPTKDGYTFNGWMKKIGTNPESGPSMTGEIGGNEGADILFTAKWSDAINYSITYDLGDGSIKFGSNPTSYNVETAPITLINPEKTGYNFIGWAGTGITGVLVNVTIPTGSIGDRTYYAQWQPTNYTITYDFNGGADSALPKRYDITTNTTITFPVRAGYSFRGWNVKYGNFAWKTGNITISGAYNNTQNYLSEPIVLRAGRSYYLSSAGTNSRITLRIFNLNGTWKEYAAGNTPGAAYTPSADCVAIIVATASYFNTEELRNSVVLNVVGKQNQYEIKTGSTGNLILQATWELEEYDISYNLADGELPEGLSNPSKFTVETETFSLNNPVKTGYAFDGWQNASTGNIAKNVTIAKGSTGSRTYNAMWSEAVYNISYNLNGGSADNVSVYTYSQQVTLSAPLKTGYTFAGWIGTDLTEPTKTVSFRNKLGDRSYTATWTPTTYTIGYELNGGTNDNLNPLSYTVETETFSLRAPTKSGAIFLGWYEGNDDSQATTSVTIAKGSTGNRAFNAKWNLSDYTITYNLNGGTAQGSNPTRYTTADEFTLVNPIRPGYRFGGWRGTDLSDLTEYVTVARGSTGNREYNAIWFPNEYTIIYDLKGGQVSDDGNPEYYTTATPSFTLENPVRAGYVFLGWTGTGLSAPSTEVMIEIGSTGNRTYTANWAEDGFNITYYLNGGQADNPATYTVVTETFTLNNPVQPGYRFIGWTGTGISGSGVSTSVTIPKGSTGDRTYTANWELEVYTIDYELAGGSEVLTNPTSYTYTSAPITLFTPVKAGYIFAGWESNYFDGVRQTVTINTGSTGYKSFLAVWEDGIYNITYTLNGGVYKSGNTIISNPNPTTYRYETPTISIVNPTKDGYTFAGWSGTGIGGTERNIEIPQHSTGDRNFVANWSESENIITYTLNGGRIVNGENPQSYITNSGTITIINPSKSGYNFNGWTVNQGSSIVTLNSTTKVATIDTSHGGNVDFTANWSSPITYSISYVLNKGTVATPNPTSYTVNDNITLNNPTRTGFKFMGWSGTGLGSYKYEYVSIAAGSTGNRKYTANWEVSPYTITYDYNGGYVDGRSNPLTYKVSDPQIMLVNPVRPGYTFTGWTGTGLDSMQLSVAIPSGSTGDRSYTAHYDIVNYTISYIGTDNATFTPITTYTIDTATFTLNTPSRTGYTFLGWKGTGLLNTTSTVTIERGSTGNRTYIAQWNLVDYTITYNLDHGIETVENPTIYNIESPEIELVNPERTGYTFIGWTGSNGSTKQLKVTIPTGSSGNKTYNANWSTETYTITYSGMLEGISNPTSYTPASPTFTLTNPSKTGYTFVGWIGTDLTGPTQTVTIPTGSSGNRFYTAVSRVSEFTITVSLNGGTSAAIPDSYTVDSDPITLPTPKRSGYDFQGWQGTGISGTQLTVTIPTGSTGNRSYRAVWVQRGGNTHRIYYYGFMNEPLKIQEVNGKYVNYKDYAIGADIPAITPPTVVGNKFVGWDPDITLDDYKNITGDIEVHAKYVTDSKRYTVIANGVSTSLTQYQIMTLNTDATKNGQPFQYWIDLDTREIVSYYRNYSFSVHEHDTSSDTIRLQAVYDSIDNSKAVTRVTHIEGYDPLYDWFSVYVERSVRPEYTVLQHGIIFTTDSSVASGSNFKIGAPNTYNPVAHNSTNERNSVWTVSIRNPRQYGGPIYLKSYVKVVDDEGNVFVQYSTNYKTYSNTEDQTP